MAAAQPEIVAAGGELVGYFTPQLGWVARQVALLRFRKTRQAVLSEIEAKAGILSDEDIFNAVS